ncbi:MAG: hypothetical protein P8Y54_14115 [Xanthomonadales bacterium]
METILFFATIAILVLMTMYGIHRIDARRDRWPVHEDNRTSEARGGKPRSARAARERAYVEWFTREGAEKTA